MVRLTYERDEPNGGDDVDDIAVVIQSNATNFPTLVVPVCARVIPEGQERSSIECTSPVSVPAGERDDSLCQ